MQEYSLLTERLRQRTSRKPVYIDDEDGMEEEEWEEEEAAAEEVGEEEDEEKEVLKMEQVGLECALTHALKIHVFPSAQGLIIFNVSECRVKTSAVCAIWEETCCAVILVQRCFIWAV